MPSPTSWIMCACLLLTASCDGGKECVLDTDCDLGERCGADQCVPIPPTSRDGGGSGGVDAAGSQDAGHVVMDATAPDAPPRLDASQDADGSTPVDSPSANCPDITGDYTATTTTDNRTCRLAADTTVSLTAGPDDAPCTFSLASGTLTLSGTVDAAGNVMATGMLSTLTVACNGSSAVGGITLDCELGGTLMCSFQLEPAPGA